MNHGRLLLLGGLAAGCGGDFSSAAGEMGRIEYGLHADYEMDGALTDLSIITRHPQSISTSLTSDGKEEAEEPWRITHEVAGSGATLEFAEGEEGESIPSFTLTAEEPGTYTVESYYDGELFDRIDLVFDAPASLAVTTWIRPAGEDEFDQSSEEASLSVQEGDQVALIPIPYGSSGERLAGDLTVAYSYTPEWAAIQAYSMLDVYEEEGVPGMVNSDSLIFIEPAEVIVTIADEPNGISETRTFSVAPLEQ